MKTFKIENPQDSDFDINKIIGRIGVSIGEQKDDILSNAIIADIKKYPDRYPFKESDEIYFLDRERLSDLLRKGLEFEKHDQKWNDLKNWLDSLCVTLINDGLIDEVNSMTDVLSKMEELEKKYES